MPRPLAPSADKVNTTFRVLVKAATDAAATTRERRPTQWVDQHVFCNLLREAGLKETPRTVYQQTLLPLQATLMELGLPDLTSLVVQKQPARKDEGQIIRPPDQWWEAHVQAGTCTAGDVSFWFAEYKRARSYPNWPEEVAADPS